ncbi:MAG: MFS transporter [Flammeovirgaceae bacterium]|nr:MFS transporter [Flammeovirgaceae bacterium]|tara:strand:+ start:843 stop:2168 length:1326 start_codon:yes stop_codon:yes gene_type:complete
MAMNSEKTLFGHPYGLYVLFFTELWERFSYYGMRALLVLFLISETTSDNPGYGWTESEAIYLYGWYTMLVYVAGIPGGWLADKVLGQKKTVMLGGALLVLGHSILAIDNITAFYTGLGFIILGVGGLKPNISTMVGGLYSSDDNRRDIGFKIFYMGINIGAFLSAIIIGGIGEVYGWHYGFGLAGIGMLLGQIVFMWGQKYLVGIGDYIGKQDNPDSEKMNKPLTSIEKDRVKVLLLSFLIVVVFWGAFEQAGGLMNIYAFEKTNRVISSINFEVPATWFQSLNAGFIVLFAVAVGKFWAWWKSLGRESALLFQMAVGVIIMALGFAVMSEAALEFERNGSSAMYYLVLAYLLHTLGELCTSPTAMALITKLAPVKYASIMMGTYFACTGFGNKLAAELGEWAQTAGEYEIFLGIFIFCTIFGLLVIALMKPLKRLTHGLD